MKTKGFGFGGVVFCVVCLVLCYVWGVECASDCHFYSFEDATTMLITSARCREFKLSHSSPPTSMEEPSFVSFLDALASNTHVREIKFTDNGFGDEGIAAIVSALLRRNTDLYELEIVKNGITDNGAKAIALLLSKSTALREFSVAFNNIADKGAADIALALPQQTHEIDLAGNDIGDMGFLALLKAAGNTMLKEIDLDGNVVTDDGAVAAASLLVEMTTDRLREISVEHNHIGHEGEAALRAAELERNSKGKLPLKIEVSRTPKVFNAQKAQSPKLHDLHGWSVVRVAEWIVGVHPSFKQYQHIFLQNDIDGSALVSLSDEKLESLGIHSTLHRQRILAEIKRLLARDELR